MAKMGGSGRGNAGVAGRHMDGRPNCYLCDTPMKSNGKKDWKCKPCNVYERKVFTSTNRQTIQQEENLWGYDTDAAEAYAKQLEKDHAPGAVYVVVAAQNNTGLFKAYFDSLKTYLDHRNAKLVIIPSHYENLTAMKKGQKSWVPDVAPYLVHGDLRLGHVSIQAHIKINATAVKPLSGMESIGGDSWTIFGHPRQHLVSVATPPDLLPKMMLTTGSLTKRNYSVSKAGAKGEFNHVSGALVVEFNENGSPFPHIRQINANGNGHFYDLDKRYTPSGVTSGHRVLALIPGDEHEKFNIVEGVTYQRPDSMAKVLRPRYIVRHDVLDGYAGSHHHEKDPVLQFKKHHNGDNDYRKELDACVDFINRTTPEDAINLIVPSNHHDHLKKWLDSADANKDHTNSMLISELQLMMRQAVIDGLDYDPFTLYCTPRLKVKTQFMSRNKLFMIKGISVDQHGDIGTNGSRGSINSFAKATFKSIVGHGHSAGIIDGCFQVGKSTGRQGYEKGWSSHSITHAVVYQDGKRSLLTVINDQWKK